VRAIPHHTAQGAGHENIHLWKNSTAIYPDNCPELPTNSFYPIKFVFFLEIKGGKVCEFGKAYRKYTVMIFS